LVFDSSLPQSKRLFHRFAPHTMKPLEVECVAALNTQ